MAEPGVSGVYSSQFLVNSESNNEVNSCQRCRIYEILLKETLDELNTTQTINAHFCIPIVLYNHCLSTLCH